MAARARKKATRKKATRKKTARKKKAARRKRAGQKSPQAAHQATRGSLLPDRVAPEGGGKPTVVIDPKQLRLLAQFGCSQRDIAALMRISRETLDRCLSTQEGLLEEYEHGQATMRRNIRVAQLQTALNDRNPTMLIWLGKTELKQREVLRLGTEPIDEDETRPFLEQRAADFVRMLQRDDSPLDLDALEAALGQADD